MKNLQQRARYQSQSLQGQLIRFKTACNNCKVICKVVQAQRS